MLKVLFLSIFVLQNLINIDNLKFGKMLNVSLNVPRWSFRLMDAPILNGTCEECLCGIITNISYFNSIDIASFNCFINNQTCQFFSKSTFYEYWFNNDTNTIFYFLEKPASMLIFFNNYKNKFVKYRRDKNVFFY